MANGNKTQTVTAEQAQQAQQKAQQDYYHQMAQQYGMTDDQFARVVGPQTAGQAVPNYGQPTSYFTPERQMSPSGKWTDISPQQNANFASLQQLNQVGLLGGPQVQQPPAGQTLADLWNAFKAQGQQKQAPAQQPQSAITPTTPYQGQALTQGTPFATIPNPTPPAGGPSPLSWQGGAGPGGFTPTFNAPPAPGQGDQQWLGQQQQGLPVRGYAQGGVVTDPSQPRQMGQQDGQQTGQSGQYATSPVGLPQNAMTELGTRALGAVGFPMQAIYNPTPQPATQGSTGQGSQSPYGGGVYTGSLQPTVSAEALGGPGGSWDQLASTNNLGPGDIAELKKTGLTPDQLTQGSHFGLNLQAPGGTPTVPGVFSSAPRLAPSGAFSSGGGSTGGGGATGGWAAAGITPTMPANAAGAGSGTPWATAPPAPTSAGMGGGVSPALMQAHTSALENAGKAFYAHQTGLDPDKATFAHILDFHTNVTNQISQHTAGANPLIGTTPTPPAGGPSPMAATGLQANLPGISGGVPAFGSAPVTPPAATPPKRMAFGGFVHGRGNGDIVPAYLEPGEYVLNRQQVSQLTSGQKPVLKMQSGGEVPSYQPDVFTGNYQPFPPEAQRRRLTTSSQSSAAPSSAEMQAAALGPQGAAALNVPGAGQVKSGPYSNADMQAAALGSQGASQLGVEGAGQSVTGPYSNEEMASAALGGGPAPASASSGQASQVSGAIGGLASGFAAAAKTYADSIKPFTVHEAKMSYVGQAPAVQLAQNQAQAPPNADYYRNYFPSMS